MAYGCKPIAFASALGGRIRAGAPGLARLRCRAMAACAASFGLIAARPCLAWQDLSPVSEPAARPPAAAPGEAFTESMFLQLGFSFMVGLAVGYALKIAFKIALVVFGIVLLGVFGLQYAGLVHVDWSGVEVHYDTWADWLSVNGGAFLDFMGRNLSGAASFVAGLALGLKL